MEYRLSITKITESSVRGPTMDPYGTGSDRMTYQALEVTLTEEEFKAIKKAVLEVM